MKRILGLLLALLIADATIFARGAAAQAKPDAYVASVSGQATTAAVVLSIEAPAAAGFRLAGYCYVTSNATAAGPVTTTVQRRTTASSGGTALTAEGTGATAVSKTVVKRIDGTAVPNFPGVARLNGTPGTAGAVFDQSAVQVGVITTGTGPLPICKYYGISQYEPMPTVSAGVTNGLSITVSAAGAGGLAVGAISATILIGE